MHVILRSSGARFVLVLTAAWLFAGCDVTIGSQGRYVEREKKDFQVSGTAELVLSTFDGSIEIRSWDRPEVSIEIEKRGTDKRAVDDIKVTATQSENRINLDVQLPTTERRHFGFMRSRTAHLVVSVPHETNIKARSGDGTVTIERVSGKLQLDTGDGNIRVFEVAGELRAHTGDGSVRLDRVDGRIDVETGDGTIEVDGKLESVRLHTGDGSVTLRAATGSRMSDNWDIHTGDGSVGVELPEPFNADLDVHTNDGRISVDTLQVKGEVGKRTVRGQLGEGGRTLRVTSGDGTITLSRS